MSTRLIVVLAGLLVLFIMTVAGGNGSCVPVEPQEGVCQSNADCDDGDPRTMDVCGETDGICHTEPYGCSSQPVDELDVCPIVEGYVAECQLYAPTMNKGGWYNGICAYEDDDGCQSEQECNPAGGEYFFCYYGQCLLNYHDSCTPFETGDNMVIGTPCVDWSQGWFYLGFCFQGLCSVEGRSECHPADAMCDDSDLGTESWCSPRTFSCVDIRFDCYTDVDCPVGTGCHQLPLQCDGQDTCQTEQSFCYELEQSCTGLEDGWPCEYGSVLGHCFGEMCLVAVSPGCVGNHCAAGEVCYEDVCTSGCLEDTDCAPQQYCDTSLQGSVGHCASTPIPCAANTDCPESMYCGRDSWCAPVGHIVLVRRADVSQYLIAGISMVAGWDVWSFDEDSLMHGLGIRLYVSRPEITVGSCHLWNSGWYIMLSTATLSEDGRWYVDFYPEMSDYVVFSENGIGQLHVNCELLGSFQTGDAVMAGLNYLDAIGRRSGQSVSVDNGGGTFVLVR